jgi:hypothetical protein
MQAHPANDWIAQALAVHRRALALAACAFGIVVVLAYGIWLRGDPAGRAERELALLADTESAALCAELGVIEAAVPACQARIRELQERQALRHAAAFPSY